MKKLVVVLSLLITVVSLATGSLAVNKDVISKNVDTIVAEIDGGKDATMFKAEDTDPYAFILEESGKLIVHPSLTGKSLKEKAPPVYQALLNATVEGVWVQYEWKGKTKNTYAKKTKNNLIVGSGY